MEKELKLTYDNNSLNTYQTNKSTEASHDSFSKFLSNNKTFFNKFGLEEFLNDPIFSLSPEEEAKPESWDEKNNSINKSISSTCICCNENSKMKFFCKFCGAFICNKCKSQIRKRNNKDMCFTCERKFKVFDLQSAFRNKFEAIEDDIKELTQNSETTGLKLSEATTKLEKTKNLLVQNRQLHADEIQSLNNEKESFQNKIQLCDKECIKLTTQINQLIDNLKIKNDEYEVIDNKYKSSVQNRENMYKEYIVEQDKLNRLNKENRDLSLSIQSYNSQINKRIIINFASSNIETLYIEPITLNNEKSPEFLNKTKESFISNKTKSSLMKISQSLLNK